jgi:peptide deformylase
MRDSFRWVNMFILSLDTEVFLSCFSLGNQQYFCYQQETLRVKDDELHQLLQDIRARDSTINEIADKLHETAEAAETAASAARSIDEERRNLSSKVERMKWNHEKEVQLCLLKVINTY